jgi:hypothetical protein
MFLVELGNFTTAPILGINAGTDVTVKRGIRPIDHAGHSSNNAATGGVAVGWQACATNEEPTQAAVLDVSVACVP